MKLQNEQIMLKNKINHLGVHRNLRRSILEVDSEGLVW